MKKTNYFAVVACILGFAAAVGTLVFMLLLGVVAVVGLFTPYTLFISAVLGLYLAFVGFTLFCLFASAVGTLVFTVIKRRTLNRIFLGISIAAAALNLIALIIMTVPLIISSFSPEDGGVMLVFAIIAPAVACLSDATLIGFAIAALNRETRLIKEESIVSEPYSEISEMEK